MRILKENEDLTGKVCVCSVGRPGIVVGKKKTTFENDENNQPEKEYEVWFGLGLDGKGNWCSTNPCVVAESGEEFYERLSDRFGGKMSYNS